MRAADRAFRELPPEEDLVNLGLTMAHQWHNPAEDKVVLLEDLSYDGSIREPSKASFDVFRAAEQASVPNPFAAARAAEYLAFLDREAPLLAWPIVICVFLKHLPPQSRISFDLSEDALQNVGDDDFDAAEHVASWWEWASSTLASNARLMGRMFAVLTSFDGELGREYWFARAAELLNRLQSTAPSTAKAKGDRLEALIEALLRTEEPELTVVEKNYRTAAEEIDVVVTNSLRDPFWVAHASPLILVECKNRVEKAGVTDLRVFESKIRDRGVRCKIGIFLSTSGFTKPFVDRLQRFQATGGVIFAIDGKAFREIIETKTRLTDWLRSHTI
jgi:hypothetical protein